MKKVERLKEKFSFDFLQKYVTISPGLPAGERSTAPIGEVQIAYL